MRTALVAAFVFGLAWPARPVGAQNLLQNPHFDHDLVDWTSAFTGDLSAPNWSTTDAYGAVDSGSVFVGTFSTGTSRLSQCVMVQPGVPYQFGGSVQWQLKGNGFVGLSLTFHSDPTCSSPTASAGLVPPQVPFGSWEPLALTITSPDGAKSALVQIDASSVYIPGPFREPPIAYGLWDNLYLKPLTPTPLPMSFHTLAPCRLLDTREANGPTHGEGLPPSSDRLFAAWRACGIPATAAAAALNVTVTQPTDVGDLRLYVRDTPLPLASAINYGPGQTRANGIVVPLGLEGEIVVRCEQRSGTVHLIVDVTGYFE